MPDRTSPRPWGRPTTYKGVKMRSRTEAAYAARLDNASIAWQYEPRCFADETGQYLPDFRIVDRGCVVYIEVKGAWPDDIEAVQRSMEIIWASEPRAMLVIAITATGESLHSHPDEPGEWFHQNPNRWTDPKPRPAGRKPSSMTPAAVAGITGPRLALGGIRSPVVPAPSGAAGARLALGGVRPAANSKPDGAA